MGFTIRLHSPKEFECPQASSPLFPFRLLETDNSGPLPLGGRYAEPLRRLRQDHESTNVEQRLFRPSSFSPSLSGSWEQLAANSFQARTRQLQICRSWRTLRLPRAPSL